MSIHGGPHSILYKDFERETSYLASRGFAVVQPLFRLTPLDFDHYKDGLGEYGTGAIEDNLNVMNMLIQRSIIDPERIIVLVHSYGGHAALRIMTGLRDFLPKMNFTPKAYISINGLSDLVKEYEWGEKLHVLEGPLLECSSWTSTRPA